VYNTTLITAPAAEPISTADAKAHCRVTIATVEDTYIDALVKAARMHVEKAYGLALITQTWDMYLQDWPAGDSFHVRFPPLQSITSINYTDVDDTETEFSSTLYHVDIAKEPGRVKLAYGQSWPTVVLKTLNPIVVRLVAGYGAAGSAVPADIILAMKFLIRHWYDNRTAVETGVGIAAIEIPQTFHMLMDGYERRGLY